MKRFVFACALLLCGGAHAADGASDAALGAPYKHIADAFAQLDPAPLKYVFADDAVLLFLQDKEPPALTIGRAAIEQRLAGTLERLKQAGKTAKITVRLSDRRETPTAVYDTGFYRLVVRDGRSEDVEYGSMMLELRKGADGTWRHRVDANGPATREAFEAAGKAAVYD
jgi:ketosteroid isomerase-like protein